MNKQCGPTDNQLFIKHAKTSWGVVIFLAVVILAVAVLSHSSSYEGYPRSAISEIATLETAFGLFKEDNGYFPRGTNGLLYLLQKPPGETNWHGPYLENTTTLPLDPWGHVYIYECPGRHNPQSYDLSSTGPDGQVDTDDDICNWEQK